jgi:hypothetical protein
MKNTHAQEMKSHAMSSMLLYTTILICLLEPYFCYSFYI